MFGIYVVNSAGGAHVLLSPCTSKEGSGGGSSKGEEESRGMRGGRNREESLLGCEGEPGREAAEERWGGDPRV